MSKLIKGMEIEALRKDFNNVKNFVFLEVQGITAQNNTGLRATLRKKKIHFKVVKNTLARMVLSEQGISIARDSAYFHGPTVLVWGTNSIAELCRELEAELKNPKTAAGYKTTIKIREKEIGDMTRLHCIVFSFSSFHLSRRLYLCYFFL